MDLKAKLQSLGLTLPPAPKPGAVYIPVRQTGNLLFVAGQVPMLDGKLLAMGALPSAVSIEQAQIAARQCVLNGLAILNEHLAGDWSRLVHFVRLGVFVASEPGFDKQHIVANGASELLEKLFGDAGRHARAATGASALPLNCSVEVDFIVEVR